MAQPRFQRLTQQRRVILEELRKVSSHPTAAGVFALVRCRLPKISLGTVYRNLELLARSGVVRKLELAGSMARYDGNTQPHDHLRCIACGRVDDLPGPPLELPKGKFAECLGYQVLGHWLELVGLCPECRRIAAPGALPPEVRPPEAIGPEAVPADARTPEAASPEAITAEAAPPEARKSESVPPGPCATEAGPLGGREPVANGPCELGENGH